MDSQIIAQLHRLSSLFMEILHIFLLPGIKTRKFGRKWKLVRRKCRLRRGRRPPTGEDFRVTFFYKPIDIVGFMCYHVLTYKKDMLKE